MPRILSDWLEHYMQYSENSEPPVLYHLWSGIAAISSALRRKCYTNWGFRGYVYPNFYICLVGPPGGRKGTAMKIAKPMVQGLKIPMGSDAVGSVQALYDEIIKSKNTYQEYNKTMKEHKSLSVWSEEFQVYLSDRDPQMIGALTDLFDCADVWKYKTLKRGIDDVGNCFLTIIGAITPSLLQSKLSFDTVGGGLISRIIFVVGYGAIKKIPIPLLTKAELELKANLEKDLQAIGNLKGAFQMGTDFIDLYGKWYINATEDDGVQSAKFEGYNARRALHLNKLCMIMSAAESSEMIIKPSHFEKALAILEATEAEMSNAFHGFGMGDHAERIAKVLSWVESQSSFTHTELVKTFYLDALPAELSLFMDVAESQGLVAITHGPNETTYKVKTKKIKGKGTKFLDKTVYRLMSHNLK